MQAACYPVDGTAAHKYPCMCQHQISVALCIRQTPRLGYYFVQLAVSARLLPPRCLSLSTLAARLLQTKYHALRRRFFSPLHPVSYMLMLLTLCCSRCVMICMICMICIVRFERCDDTTYRDNEVETYLEPLVKDDSCFTLDSAAEPTC